MDAVNFSHPWNGTEDHFKIHNQFFTTIRRHNPKKYVKGRSIGINYKERPVKVCIIRKVVTSNLPGFPESVFLQDTGYNKIDSIDIFAKMYHMTPAAIQSILFDIVYFETDYCIMSRNAKVKQLCLSFS